MQATLALEVKENSAWNIEDRSGNRRSDPEVDQVKHQGSVLGRPITVATKHQWVPPPSVP